MSDSDKLAECIKALKRVATMGASSHWIDGKMIDCNGDEWMHWEDIAKKCLNTIGEVLVNETK